MTNAFSTKDLLAIKDMLANNENLVQVKDMLLSAVGTIAAAKILKSPLLVRGVVGGVAVLATGYALMQFTNSKPGRKLRKKVATAIRDMAQDTVDTLETIQEVEKVAMSSKRA